MSQCVASVAVVRVRDYIGAPSPAGSRARATTWLPAGEMGTKLAPLVTEIEAAVCRGLSLDARQEDAVRGFMRLADEVAPLEVAMLNIECQCNSPLLETTERVFRKVWELACYAGFLTGREASRRMLDPRTRSAAWPRNLVKEASCK